jgi:hypothetical protein
VNAVRFTGENCNYGNFLIIEVGMDAEKNVNIICENSFPAGLPDYLFSNQKSQFW